jgi:arylsulfatase A-like enzyme
MNINSLLTAIACLPVATFWAPPASAAQPAPASTNIIVILADDIGWGDAGCYGATRLKTPHIDRLAAEGQRFVNGHASAAVCTPTRYSMLTGQYGFRRDAVGVNRGVANGAAPLTIPTDMVTAPGLLQAAGYHTGLVGKWHLGFGLSKPDYNKQLRPGPLEVGFDEFFGIPATNDRIPTVLVRDHNVVGLDPADPIEYTYDKKEAEALGLSPWAAGRNRIGWGKGGKAAWWDDKKLADIHTAEAVQFIERNKDKKFFLYYAPHNVHAPKIPGPRFAGTSGLGERADMLLEFDDSLGQLLQTLDRLQLTNDTLIIYSSDNGAYVNNEDGHRPTGPFRGIKSTSWEGGTRVPFIVRWPARIAVGVSEDLVSTIDIPATITAAAGIALPENSLPDSVNLLPAMLGETDSPKRDHLILQCGSGHLSVRSGSWKYIPDLDRVEGWKSPRKAPGAPDRPGLFDLSSDPGETKNLARENPGEVERLADLLTQVKATPVTRPQTPPLSAGAL